MIKEDDMSDEKPLQPWAEEAFEFFRNMFPMIDLTSSHFDDNLWESAYVICFGVNELCEWFDCRVRVVFHCTETDFQPRIYAPDEDLGEAIMQMVQAFVDNPYEIGTEILNGAWQPDDEFIAPDHIARLTTLEMIQGGDGQRLPEGTRGTPEMLDRLIMLMRSGAITPEEWADSDPEILAAIPERMKEQMQEIESQIKQVTADPICRDPQGKARWESYWKHPVAGSGYLH